MHIDDIPDDVLLQFLDLCVDPTSIKAAIHLSAVCYRWRTLALSVSQWWTSITLAMEKPEYMSLARLFLSGAKERPINLNILPFRTDRIRGEDLVPFIQRAKSLKMKVNMLGYTFYLLPTIPITRLELSGELDPDCLLGGDACQFPNLHVLRLTRFSSFSHLPSNLANRITTLEFERWSDIETVLVCLRSCINLQHLVFEDLNLLGSYALKPTVNLPHLVTLDLTTTRFENLLDFVAEVIIGGGRCVSLRRLRVYSPDYLDLEKEGWVKLCRNITHLRLKNGGLKVKGFPWEIFEKLEFVDVDNRMRPADIKALVSGTKGHLKAVRCSSVVRWEKEMV